MWRAGAEVRYTRTSVPDHTRIGRTLVITGELESSEDLLIEGRVNGHLVVRDAQLTVTPTGTVEAQVHGTRVLVEGQVKGGITATERIELSSKCRVEGSLSADRIVMWEGARFDGGIDMRQRTIAAKMAQFRTGAAAGK
jgi:cytoskeletal protein CcmA (bactofilin family)